MDRHEEFKLQTALNRILLEAGLDLTSVTDPTEALREHAKIGDPRAALRSGQPEATSPTSVLARRNANDGAHISTVDIADNTDGLAGSVSIAAGGTSVLDNYSRFLAVVVAARRARSQKNDCGTDCRDAHRLWQLSHSTSNSRGIAVGRSSYADFAPGESSHAQGQRSRSGPRRPNSGGTEHE